MSGRKNSAVEYLLKKLCSRTYQLKFNFLFFTVTLEATDNEACQLDSRWDCTSLGGHLPEGPGGLSTHGCLDPPREHNEHHRGFLDGQALTIPSRRQVVLPCNLVIAWGLWRTRFWAVVGWLATLLLLQFIPFMLFTEFFATNPQERTILHGLLAVDAILLGIFFVLLLCKKRK